MTKSMHRLVFGLSLPLLLLADFSPEAPLGIGFVPEAAAIVGRPATPVSYAGVARRTTRRVVYAETAAVATTTVAVAAASRPPPPAAPAGPVPIGAVVHALPPGCAATPINGVEYYNCAPGVYYRAVFQGNNLVYVSAQP